MKKWIVGGAIVAVIVGSLIIWYVVAVDNAVSEFKARCADTYNGTVTEETVFRGMTPIYGANGQITGWVQNYGTHFECVVNGTRVDELDI